MSTLEKKRKLRSNKTQNLCNQLSRKEVCVLTFRNFRLVLSFLQVFEAHVLSLIIDAGYSPTEDTPIDIWRRRQEIVVHSIGFDAFVVSFLQSYLSAHTVNLARAKLPANAGNFTCSSQVKRSLARFTCVTCSLPVITGKFTCFEAASTSRRIHAHCLRAHVNLPEYHRYFTGSFTCGTHANLPATSMQNCLLLQAKIHANYRQKHWNRR